MKPHDQWNSTDIAENLGRMSMHVDVYDAEPPKPAKRVRYVDTGWWLGLGIVACVSGMVALVMLMWGMW